MLIGVDAGCLGTNNLNLEVGVYQVAYNLIKELSVLDKKNVYLLYSFESIPERVMSNFGSNMKNIVVGPKKGWITVGLPFQFLKQKPDLFLALSQVMPWYHPFKTIGFVHGLDLEKKFHPGSFASLKNRTEHLIENADVIVTTSHFLEKGILEINPKAKIQVLNLGSGIATPVRQLVRNDENVRPYFLFVGALKRTKNIPRILEAFDLFLKETKSDVDLLLVGSGEWLDPGIGETIDKLKLYENVIMLKPVKQEDLVSYYHGAIALVSPSLYEGFGLTLVEAMSCGCVVICGNKSAENEVVGSGGILVDPEDVGKIANAMLKVYKNKKFAQSLRDAGLKKSKEYSWRKFAEGVLGVVESCRGTKFKSYTMIRV